MLCWCPAIVLAQPKEVHEFPELPASANPVDGDLDFLLQHETGPGIFATKRMTLQEIRKRADVTTVANVAALYALTAARDNQLYLTLGYSNEGVGANLYRYDAGSSAAVDYGFVLDGVGGNGTGTGTGRFIATDQTIAVVTKFGALGDGTTDDQLACQRAANAIAVTGGTVFFTPGLYNLVTATNTGTNWAHIVLEDDDNVSFIGHGATLKSSHTQGAGTAATIFELDGTRNVVISGFRIDGSHSRTGSTVNTYNTGVVDLLSTSREGRNLVLADLNIDNVYYTLRVNRPSPVASGPRFVGIKIDNVIQDGGYYGLLFQENGDNATVRSFTTKSLVRSYFPFGVDSHHVQYTSDGGDVFTDTLIKAYELDTTNVFVKARISNNTSADAKVSIESQHDPIAQPTPGKLRNIFVDVDDTGSTGTKSVRFAYFQDSTETDTVASTLFDNIVIRGHVRNDFDCAVTQTPLGHANLDELVIDSVSTPNAPAEFWEKIGNQYITYGQSAIFQNEKSVWFRNAAASDYAGVISTTAIDNFTITAFSANKALQLAAAGATGKIDFITNSAIQATIDDTGLNLGASNIIEFNEATSVRAGAGSPESVVTATVGSLYFQTDAVAGSQLWTKETGTGNTGWSQASAGSSNSFETIASTGATSIVAESATDTFNFEVTAPFHVTTDTGTDTLTLDLDNPEWFSAIDVSGQATVNADADGANVTLAGMGGIAITTNATTDTITIDGSGIGGISDGDKGDILVSGTGTEWRIDDDPVTLTPDSATPSVTDIRFAQTANTVSTNYTNFTGGVSGQTLTIHVNDANTAFTNNANLALIGGANIPASSDAYTVVFQYDGTEWVQLSYSSRAHQLATSVDGSDNITVSNTTTDSDVDFNVAGTSGVIRFDVAGTDRLLVDNTGVDISGILDLNGVDIRTGTGSPEGVVTGDSGDLFFRTDGGAGTSAYLKEDDGDNTTWTAFAFGGGGLPAGGSVGDLIVNDAAGSGDWSSVLSVGANGATITGGTVATNSPMLTMTQTWNASGTSFRGIDMDITDTASAATSYSLYIHEGATAHLAVDKDGINIGRRFRALGGDNTSPAYQIENAQNGFYILSNAIYMKGEGVTRAIFGSTTTFNYPVLLPRSVEANTAGTGSPNVLTSAESYKVLTNEGIAEKNFHTLPTAAAGLSYTFVVQDADGIRVTASTGDTIRLGNKVTATAGYVESTTIGDTVTIVAINATEWVMIAGNGTWTDGTFTWTDTSST
jgi:hypothetical protein